MSERRIKSGMVTAALLLCAGASRADAGLASAFQAARAAVEAPLAAAAVEGEDTTAEPAGTVLSDRTTEVEVALNKNTVKCSRADYQAPMLKVLIPALAELTVLNHRNTAEGAPCVSAGNCWEQGPETILGAGEGTDRIGVRVILSKRADLDGAVCRVQLVETVSTVIRGTPFFHERRQVVAERVADDCR